MSNVALVNASRQVTVVGTMQTWRNCLVFEVGDGCVRFRTHDEKGRPLTEYVVPLRWIARMELDRRQP